MDVSVQASTELQKKYTENEHVLDNILINFIISVGISDSDMGWLQNTYIIVGN
jgi:hypothetical protein